MLTCYCVNCKYFQVITKAVSRKPRGDTLAHEIFHVELLKYNKFVDIYLDKTNSLQLLLFEKIHAKLRRINVHFGAHLGESLLMWNISWV